MPRLFAPSPIPEIGFPVGPERMELVPRKRALVFWEDFTGQHEVWVGTHADGGSIGFNPGTNTLGQDPLEVGGVMNLNNDGNEDNEEVLAQTKPEPYRFRATEAAYYETFVMMGRWADASSGGAEHIGDSFCGLADRQYDSPTYGEDGATIIADKHIGFMTKSTDTTNKLYFSMKTDTGTLHQEPLTTSIEDNKWVRLGWRYDGKGPSRNGQDGGSFWVYVNGVLEKRLPADVMDTGNPSSDINALGGMCFLYATRNGSANARDLLVDYLYFASEMDTAKQ